MYIIQIPGFDTIQGQQFFLKLNEALGLNFAVKFYEWSINASKNDKKEADMIRVISNLTSVLNATTTQNPQYEIWAKSMGAYFAIEAIKKLAITTSNVKGNITIKIFGLPYRLGYPPNINKLSALNTTFEDELLIQGWMEELGRLPVSVVIFQGEKDDLGPFGPLLAHSSVYENISVIKILGEGHSLDPLIVEEYITCSDET